MKLWKQAALAIAILVAGALAFVYAWDAGSDAQEASGQRGDRGAPPRVFVAPAVYAPTEVRVEAVGTAEAILSASIHPAVAGEVTAVRFQPNERVKEGDVLVELDQRSERLAVQLAEVRVKDARQLLARYERTRGTGAVAASTMDQAATALETARLQLRQAQTALADRTVRAPFSGHVGLTDVDVGDRIGPETAITTLDDRSALTVSFAVPELYHRQIGVGREVSVRAWAAGDEAVVGEVVDVDSRIDPGTRSFTVRARAPNPDDRLRPGMSFAVVVTLVGEAYLRVPEAAVQWGAGGAYIWVVRDGNAKRISVVIAARQEGAALVEAAVDEGEPIVVEGIQRARDGRPVKTEPAAGSASAPPVTPPGA